MTTSRNSNKGLIWLVSASALLVLAMFFWAMFVWPERQKQERRDIEMAAAMADSLRSKQTDATANAVTKDDGDPYIKYGGHIIPQTTADAPKDRRRSLSAPDPGKASAAKQTSRRASKDHAEFGGRLVSPAADKPKNDAVLGSAYTVSACPPSLPAGTKPKLFSLEELKKVIGTKAELSEACCATGDDWLYDRVLWETRLKVLNGTKHCISAIELELTLQYRGIPLKERHTVSFKPILGPGQEGHDVVTLRRRTKKNGDPLGLQEWHVTKVWGFHYLTSD
jgi:hypothetical protein